jgi:hypothetical protein
MLPGASGWREERTPEEEVAYRDRLEEVVEEKRRALEDPGPPWKEWFLFDGAKWWVGLGFLIADVWIISGGLEVGSLLLALAPLVPATYLQLLAWRYLWYRPHESRLHRHDFQRTWFRPVEFGRWTPEGAVVRAGGHVISGPQGPNPREFL